MVVVKRTFTSPSDHERLKTLLVHGAYAMLSNIEHNTAPEKVDGAWAHRIAYTQSVGRDDTGQLRRVARDRIAEFAESIDDIFIAYEALHKNGSRDPDKSTVAVGVFYFEEQDENANYEW